MEEEDEFGDLYTDVLLPFSTSVPSSAPLAPSHLLDSSFNRTLKPAKTESPIRNSSTNDLAVTSEKSHNRSEEENPEAELQFDIDSESAIPDFGSETRLQWENSTAENAEDEEESESDDDLQIVLNDTRGGKGDGEEEDEEDGEGLIIVADGDAGKPTVEEPNWGAGEDAGATGGEKREGGDKGGGPGAANAGQKIGSSNYNYHHPFHSQFKYVRPGAAPLPGSTNSAASMAPQVRPSMAMNAAGGRGRGGIKAPPTPQKGYFSPFPGTSWTGAGRGLDFTLPSHKAIVDVDIDIFEEKPWRYPGVDLSDYFNFDMNEESWKEYCKLLGYHRMENTMQSKIRVYEVGRGEPDYDPDMPPELAAASGVHDFAFENTAKSGAASAQGSLRLRQLPTGRAIQVETGQGDRLPSVDTRPPRIRDCDAIIEIICQGSLDSESSEGNNVAEETEERVSSAVEVELSKPEASNIEGNGVKSTVEDAGSLPNVVRHNEVKNEAPEVSVKENADNFTSLPARSSEESKPRSGTSAEEVREISKSDPKRIPKGSQANHRTSRKDDHLKHESHDRRREVEPPELTWQRRHDGLRKNRSEDSRVRDNRNGSYRDRYETEKRRKEDEHSRREEPRDRRRREWEDGVDSRKRNDNAPQTRQRERESDRIGRGRDRERDRDRDRNGDREREEITRTKTSNEENVIRRERETVKNSSEREHKKRHRIEENPRRNDDNKMNKANSRPTESTENHRQRKRDENVSSSMKKKEGEKNSSAKKQKEEQSTDEDEENAKRGRSKLERWNSHKEDCDAERNTVEGPLKAESVSVSGEAKENEVKPAEEKSLDPAERMKKRSERFKLPMPSEKETATPADKNVSEAEGKLERPARKRRWVGN